MKVFEIPKLEIVLFDQTDVMTASPFCICVDADCPYNEAYQANKEKGTTDNDMKGVPMSCPWVDGK